MKMDIAFGGKMITTTVYIKMDAIDQLLLSEDVCRQLIISIVTYHPSLVPGDPTKHTGVAVVLALESVLCSP